MRVLGLALAAAAVAAFAYGVVRLALTTTCLGFAHEHCLFEGSAHPPQDLEAWRRENGGF